MTVPTSPDIQPVEDKKDWQAAVAPFQEPNLRLSIMQIFTSIVPFFVMMVVMYWSLSVSYWLTILLAIPTAGFVMRSFIIFHDCGHGSFFKSRRLNNALGAFIGLITFTPYYAWKRSHAVHHASSGDLDRRGRGDVWTITVREYLELSPLMRLWYRIYRFPLTLFFLGPWFNFIVIQRFPIQGDGPREKRSIMETNIGIVLFTLVGMAIFGVGEYLLIYTPIIFFASSLGVFLFYVQHNFEGTYWEHHDNWNYVDAALHGSSYLKLPRILQWFSGNIGFHHVHHLSPRIPNYYLEACHNTHPLFRNIQPLTLWGCLKASTFRLWDEDSHQMVGLKFVKELQAQKQPAVS